MGRSTATWLVGLLLVAASCGGDSDDPAAPTTATTPSDAATSTSIEGATTSAAGPPPAVRLVKLADVEDGTAIATRSGDATVYVTEQAGRVLAFRDGKIVAEPVLDITADVLAGGERGLLGLAFSADGGTLYAYWTAKQPVGEITVAAFPFDGRRADGSRRTVLLTIPHAENSNHNGGILQLGPDGFLYMGVGDGGGGGDLRGNAQNRDVLLGKVLRIDPTKPADGKPYGIPAGNPFERGGGRAEIWAFGLRNPWRLSFDPPTGSLWIADVGQNQYEEVNRVSATTPGVNYGWNPREGLHTYKGGSKPAGAVDPVAELDHDDSFCSVTGGHVYRGGAMPGLVGRYVFGDFCNPKVLTLTEEGGTWKRTDLSARADGIRSFGPDPAGELLVLSSGGLSRLAPA